VDGNEIKILYSLGMWMEFYFGDEYRIMKLVTASSYCHL